MDCNKICDENGNEGRLDIEDNFDFSPNAQKVLDNLKGSGYQLVYFSCSSSEVSDNEDYQGPGRKTLHLSDCFFNERTDRHRFERTTQKIAEETIKENITNTGSSNNNSNSMDSVIYKSEGIFDFSSDVPCPEKVYLCLTKQNVEKKRIVSVSNANPSLSKYLQFNQVSS